MSTSIATIIAALSITAQEAVQKVIDQATSRTLVSRRVEQAAARIVKAEEAIAYDRALIEALKVHGETLPVEAGSALSVRNRRRVELTLPLDESLPNPP